jgi:hypothetical protein
MSGEIKSERRVMTSKHQSIKHRSTRSHSAISDLVNSEHGSKLYPTIEVYEVTFGPGTMGMTLSKDFSGRGLVSKLVPGGPAAENGVGIGDHITGIARKRVDDYEEIMHMIPCMHRPLVIQFSRQVRHPPPHPHHDAHFRQYSQGSTFSPPPVSSTTSAVAATTTASATPTSMALHNGIPLSAALALSRPVTSKSGASTGISAETKTILEETHNSFGAQQHSHPPLKPLSGGSSDGPHMTVNTEIAAPAAVKGHGTGTGTGAVGGAGGVGGIALLSLSPGAFSPSPSPSAQFSLHGSRSMANFGPQLSRSPLMQGGGAGGSGCGGGSGGGSGGASSCNSNNHWDSNTSAPQQDHQARSLHHQKHFFQDISLDEADSVPPPPPPGLGDIGSPAVGTHPRSPTASAKVRVRSTRSGSGSSFGAPDGTAATKSDDSDDGIPAISSSASAAPLPSSSSSILRSPRVSSKLVSFRSKSKDLADSPENLNFIEVSQAVSVSHSDAGKPAEIFPTATNHCPSDGAHRASEKLEAEKGAGNATNEMIDVVPVPAPIILIESPGKPIPKDLQNTAKIEHSVSHEDIYRQISDLLDGGEGIIISGFPKAMAGSMDSREGRGSGTATEVGLNDSGGGGQEVIGGAAAVFTIESPPPKYILKVICFIEV